MSNEDRPTMGDRQASKKRALPPALALFVFWGLLLWGLLVSSLPLRAAGPTPGSPGQEAPPAPVASYSNAPARSSEANGGAGPRVAAASTDHDAVPNTSQDSNLPSAPQADAPRATATPPAPDPDAGWTPATRVNSWLPHWLRVSGEFRNRDEGHTAYRFTSGKDDAYGLTRALLGFDISPARWLHGFVQARDAEVIGANPVNVTSSMKDVFDLTQAYVEFRNAENGWFSLKTGRQELVVGDERLIGKSNWSNASRVFDAVRLTLRSQASGVRFDAFASSVVKAYPTSLDRNQPGHNLYGLSLAANKLVPRAAVEPFVYLKTVPFVTGVDKVSGNERLYTSGFRLKGTIPGGFDYRMRYSYQSGHLANESVRAWGGYAVLGYTIPSRLQPRFSMEYAYASGDKASGDRTLGTFDQLYPSNHGLRGVTDLFGGQNIVDLRPGFDFRPQRKTRLYFNVHNLSLASRHDNLYDNNGAVAVKAPKGGALSTSVGHEADIYGTYDVNRRLQLAAGFGHLYAGRFLQQTSPGASVSYPYGFLDYTF